MNFFIRAQIYINIKGKLILDVYNDPFTKDNLKNKINRSYLIRTFNNQMILQKVF